MPAARPFCAIPNHDNGQSFVPVFLPVTVAKNFHPGRNFDVALFGFRQARAAKQEKTGQGLQVPAAKQLARFEGSPFLLDLRRPHHLILNN
jgi:hypothetical protein